VIEPPEILGESGDRLWRSVLGRFTLDDHERVVLYEACRTADLIDVLELERGPEVLSKTGAKINPVFGELRQQRIALARQIAALRLPADPENTIGKKQHRSLRGVQQIGGA